MNRKTSQTRKKGIIAGLSLLLLFGPASARAANKQRAASKMPTLVWPLPPEKPRIKFVQAIYGAADVEPVKKGNFLDKVAGIQRSGFKRMFSKPFGIATDSHNRIYVADSGQGLIFVLDRDNKQVTYIGSSAQVRLRLPVGITVDAKDRIWVADAVGQHVYAFDGDGGVLMMLGRQDEMLNPTSVAVDDSRNRIYVVDSKLHKVLVFDTESGQLISTIGERGSGNGQFNFPTQVALDNVGRIYVTDTLNFRVEVFGPDYKFLESWGKQGNRFGQFLKPKGIAIDPFQNIYVVDSDFDNFQIFDQQKRLLMSLGSVGSMPGTFWLPAGIHIDRNNYIYVSDQNNRRIQIFKLLDGATAEPPAQEPKTVAAAVPVPSQGGESGVTTTSGSSHKQVIKNSQEEKKTP
jgi:DNA-binding beta-propeller fold protein YncE